MADKTAKREAAGRPPRGDRVSQAAARKPRKQADARRRPEASTESPGGRLSVKRVWRRRGSPQTIPGRNGGTLTPFQPGISGNPRRGPDRQLRINGQPASMRGRTQ